MDWDSASRDEGPERADSDQTSGPRSNPRHDPLRRLAVLRGRAFSARQDGLMRYFLPVEWRAETPMAAGGRAPAPDPPSADPPTKAGGGPAAPPPRPAAPPPPPPSPASG